VGDRAAVRPRQLVRRGQRGGRLVPHPRSAAGRVGAPGLARASGRPQAVAQGGVQAHREAGCQRPRRDQAETAVLDPVVTARRTCHRRLRSFWEVICTARLYSTHLCRCFLCALAA
jgi:hypothetical protein